MTDGSGSDPDVPPTWAADQPPAYGGGGPWTAPGAGPAGPGPAQPPPPQNGEQQYGPQYGQQGYGPPYGFRPPPQAPRPGIIPLRPLTLGDILDGTIKLIRSNPKATLGLSAIIAAITTLPTAIGQSIYFRSMAGFLNNPEAAQNLPIGGLIAQYAGAFVTLMMTFVGTTILTGILTKVLGRAVFGGRITVGEAWRLTRGRVPALLGLVLVEGLIFLAPFLIAASVVVTLAVTGTFDNWDSGEIVPAVGFLVLFLLLYFAYVLFLQAKLALSAAALVLERLGVIDSMRRSWALVRGDSWRVFGILLVTGLLAAIISGVLSVPFTFAGSIIGVIGGGSLGSSVFAAFLLAVGSVISSMLVLPFQAGVNGLLYTDRRMRAEAFDLVLQTAAVRNQAQGWIHSTVDDLWHPANAAGQVPGAMPYETNQASPYGPQT